MVKRLNWHRRIRRCLAVLSSGWILSYFVFTPVVAAGADVERFAVAKAGSSLDRQQEVRSESADIQAPDSYVCPVPLKIMPLGDSITVGKYSGVVFDQPPVETTPEDDIGYRKDLKYLLTAAEYATDFVGSHMNGQDYPSFDDPDHEAVNGTFADTIRDGIFGWLQTNPADVVLLHIGTNDINSNQPIAQVATEVGQILDAIDNYETVSGDPVYVFLARILNKTSNDSDFSGFNVLLDAMIQDRQNVGDLLYSVNMETGTNPLIIYKLYTDNPPGDFVDGVHPYSTGYQKMADEWFEVMQSAVLDFCNRAPSITTVLNDRTDDEGTVISIDVNATDPDVSDVLTYSATGLPPGLSINPVTGVIGAAIDYSASAGSPYDVTVTATDDGEPILSDSTTFSWTVDNANAPPDVTNPGTQNDTEGDIVNLPIQASDPETGQVNLSYTAVKLPAGLSINPNTGVISGTIGGNAAAGSPYQSKVTVSDNHPSDPKSTTIIFTWNVAVANSGPQVDNPPGDQAHTSGTEVELQIEATDLDGDPLTFTATGLPPDLTMHPATGIISGTLTNASAGHFLVEVVVSDGDLEASVSFDWDVTGEVFLPVVLVGGS